MTSHAEVPPLTGRSLGVYQVFELLGSGGMGEVYRARDRTLGRDVALKVLPAAVAQDPERLARFEREARALAGLNHPHVAQIYGTLDSEEVHGIMIELVPGETLAARLAATGPPPIDETLRLAEQMADALEAAHDKGIVHRDFKPANVKLTPDGSVKVLDFGLAKMGDSDEQSEVATITAAGTRRGVVLGTAGYMSPEQARGLQVDKRTDIWAFGCVLYEMLTGRAAFARGTITDTLAAVVDRQPDWSALPASTPEAVRTLLQRCLDKDSKQRLRDIGEARVVLQRARASGAPVDSRWMVLAALGAIALVAGAAIAWRAIAGAPAARSAEILSIAVLPLQNLSGDPSQEYFTDGATDELIADLAQLHALKVISRTSVMAYKGTSKTLPEIARELGVDAVLEGSIRRAGTRVRVTAQLIRGATDAHLWAGNFDEDVADVLTLQANIARAIATEIHLQIRPQDAARLAVARRVNPAARDEILLGHHYRWKGGAENLSVAVAHYKRALELQPNDAAAYAGIAMAGQTEEAPAQIAAAARSAAIQAVQLDPDLSEGHAAVATVHGADWNWRDAEREFQRALELNPNSLDACGCYALLLSALGRHSEAAALSDRLIATNPLSTVSHSTRGLVLYISRKFDDAERELRRAIELDAANNLAYRVLGEMYAHLGRGQDALRLLDRPEFEGTYPLGLAHAAAAHRAEALKIVQAVARSSHPERRGIAMVLFTLGDDDRGFDWLTKAFDAHEPGVAFMTPPIFDRVRPDPRFQTLLARLKMPPAP